MVLYLSKSVLFKLYARAGTGLTLNHRVDKVCQLRRISLWILQVVLKFWRYLSAVDPARARILASPRRRHAASQAAHNERAVRRLESGASD